MMRFIIVHLPFLLIIESGAKDDLSAPEKWQNKSPIFTRCPMSNKKIASIIAKRFMKEKLLYNVDFMPVLAQHPLTCYLKQSKGLMYSQE